MAGPLIPIVGLTAGAARILGKLVRQSPKANKAILDKVKKGTASKSEKEAVKAYRGMNAQEANRAQGLTLKSEKAPRKNKISPAKTKAMKNYRKPIAKKQAGGKVAAKKKPQSGHNRLY